MREACAVAAAPKGRARPDQESVRGWHTDFIKRPLADLKKEASNLAQPKLEKAKNAIQSPDVSSAAEIFRRGYAALVGEKSASDIALVTPWLGKEESLVAEVYAHSKGEPNSLDADQYRAAVRVGRVGQLLTEAEAAPEIDVPDAFADERPDLGRLAGRLHALGIPHPLSPTNLIALAPVELRQQLDKAREAGLLSDGADWTRNAAGARGFTQQLTREIDQAKSVERLLEDRLIHGNRRQS